MLTNVFRLGGFQQVSWFELRADFDNMAGMATRDKESIENTAAQTFAAHLRLQEEGQLTAWVCSPTQREASSQHSPHGNEDVKLWLFLPGCHDTSDSAVTANIHGLRVVRAGLWCLPGESDEISAALLQALLNRLERSMRNLTYVRFGDVFVKCKQPSSSDPRLYSDGLVTCEFSFSTSEDAIFAHAMVRKKRVRSVESNDLQTALVQHADSSVPHECSLPVVVSPHGLAGRLTGSSPNNLVHRLKRSNLQAVNDQAARSLPFPNVSFPTPNGSTLFTGNGQAWVHAGYPEVCLGWGPDSSSVGLAMESGVTSASQQIFESDGDQPSPQLNFSNTASSESPSTMRRVYIFPAEAVLTPMAPRISSHVYRKRTWLQNWSGTDWLEESSVPGIMKLAASIYWDGSDHYKIQQWKRDLLKSESQNPKSSSCSSSSEGDNTAESTSSSTGSSGYSGSDGEGEVSTFDDRGMKGESTVPKIEGVVLSKGVRRTSLNEGSSQPSEKLMSDGKGLLALKRGRSRGGGLAEPANKLARNGSMEDVSIVCEAASENLLRAPTEFNISSSTPRAPGSQAGTPWDWADDDQGIGMDMQNDADILAEFGDFGDFFEDDVLGFGEPPGTAESQALFSFGDCGEGVNTPGTVCMDTSDPLLLPILDFPSVEGPIQPAFGYAESTQRILGSIGEMKAAVDDLVPARSSTPGALQGSTSAEMESLPKAEAMIMFAPEFASVEIPATERSMVDQTLSKQSYCPEVVKGLLQSAKSDGYVYGATPPSVPRSSAHEVHVDPVVSHEVQRGNELVQQAGCIVKEESSAPSIADQMKSAVRLQSCMAPSGGAMVSELDKALVPGSQVGKLKNAISAVMQAQRLSVAQLASDFNCALLYLQLHCSKYLDPLGSMFARYLDPNLGLSSQVGWSLSVKEEVSEVTTGVDVQAERSGQHGSIDIKKKERIPSRIAGDAEADTHDGHRSGQVGVWRSVGAPKQELQIQKSVNLGTMPRVGLSAGAVNKSNVVNEEPYQSSLLRQNQWHEFGDVVPLLAQQAAVAVDYVLDGECGDGAYEWLASQEQIKRLKCCLAGMVHKDCGGMLTLRHWLEDSGLELMDPLAGEVSPAMVSTVLRRDLRWAMANSFGKTNFDGPLTVAEWYCGRTQSNDSGELADSISSDSKASVIFVSGEQLGQLHAASAPPGLVKGSFSFSSHSSIDDGCHRGSIEDSNSHVQGGRKSYDPIAHALPIPGILVGYQDDWLTTNFGMLRHWDKAPFEPYAVPKPVLYHVVCLGLDPLISAAGFFFSQLSSVYEVCGLGTHLPAGGASPTVAGKLQAGFRVVDVPGTFKGVQNPLSLPGDYVANMDRGWSSMDYRKALRAACRNIVLPLNQSGPTRDPETSPSTVVYVVCPTSAPQEVLQTMIDCCHSLGSALQISEADKGAVYGSGVVSVEDAASTPIVAFSVPRFALQVVTADVILKISGHVSSNPEILKDIAFEVYNKARRIPWRSHVIEPVQGAASRIRPGASVIMQSGTNMPGMWKDCNTNRSSVPLLSRDSSLDAGAIRSWEAPWQSSRMGDASSSENLIGTGHSGTSRTTKYVYEPAFILADCASLPAGFDLQLNRSAGKDVTDKVVGNAPVLTAGMSESGPSTTADFSEESPVAGADLHCCYTWTEDFEWLVSVWTDARAELLDIQVWPLAGVVGTSLQGLFLEILLQGFLLLQAAVDTGSKRARNVTIARIGSLTDNECQDWQSAILALGSAGKNWAVQIRQPTPEVISPLPDRIGLVNGPPSPSIPALTSRKTIPNHVKNDLNAKMLNVPAHIQFDSVKGALLSIQSINLVSIRLEHTLQIMCSSEFQAPAGPPATVGIQPVTSLAAQKAALLFIPVHSLRFLPSTIPVAAVMSDVPSIGQLLLQNSKKLVHPVASAFLVTPPTSVVTVPDWPSTLFIGLVFSFSTSNFGTHSDITLRGVLGSEAALGRRNKVSASDSKDQGLEAQRVLAVVAPQLHALSWLGASPMFLQRRSPLPFHCDIAQKLRRLLSFMVTEGVSRSA